MRKAMMFVVALCLPLQLAAQSTDSTVVSEWTLMYQGLSYRDQVTGKPMVHSRVNPKGYEYVGQSSCGYWGFSFVEARYISTLVGPFCNVLVGWFSVGVAAGFEEILVEEVKKNFYGRYALTAYVGVERLNLEYYFENGSSRSPWQSLELRFQATRALMLGGIAQTGDGFGPKLEVSKNFWRDSQGRGTGARLWVAPVFMSTRSQGHLLFGFDLVADAKVPMTPNR